MAASSKGRWKPLFAKGINAPNGPADAVDTDMGFPHTHTGKFYPPSRPVEGEIWTCSGATRWNAHPRAFTTASLMDQSRRMSFPDFPPSSSMHADVTGHERPGKGVFSLKFIGFCYIDADIGCIPTKRGPDFPSALTEGDGRTPIFSQQQIGLPSGSRIT